VSGSAVKVATTGIRVLLCVQMTTRSDANEHEADSATDRQCVLYYTTNHNAHRYSAAGDLDLDPVTPAQFGVDFDEEFDDEDEEDDDDGDLSPSTPDLRPLTFDLSDRCPSIFDL